MAVLVIIENEQLNKFQFQVRRMLFGYAGKFNIVTENVTKHAISKP